MRRSIEVTIRRARQSDRRAVREITRTIWGGGDYVPDVFDDWVKDRRGGLWLAIADGRPVGVAKLTLLGDAEAWLHALRVHQRFRGRGVARALMAFRLARAKRLGARVARLDTAHDNTPVHRLMRHFGFQRIARYAFWRARARPGPLPRRATPRDLPALVRLAKNGDGMLHEEFVRRRITRDDVARAVRAGRCLVAGLEGRPGAMAIVESYDDRLRLHHLAGSGQALGQLLRALPAEAARRRKARVGSTASAIHWRALRRAGYRRAWSGSMYLFEKRL